MATILKGECNHCGDCCRAAGWFSIYAREHLIDYLLKRGCHVVERADEPPLDGERIIDLLIPNLCAQLYERDGKWLCRLHDCGKPKICQEWPYSAADIAQYSRCSLYFEEE